MSVKGCVFSILRSTFHDGPGLRTAVYLKGCTLRCAWCHNPEGLSAKPQIVRVENRCIGCGKCRQVCPECHGGDGVFHREACKTCGRCVEACPTGALEMCGTMYEAEALLPLLLQDAHYYRRTGGGVTFSGGECLMQSAFTEEMCRLLRKNDVHTLLETALNVPWKDAEAALAADSLYIDVKHMDTDVHRRYTGCGNERILQNLRRLCDLRGDIRLRTPLIPGVNDGWDNLLAAARLAVSLAPAVTGLTLLRYNPLGETKYRRLDMEFTPFAADPQKAEAMADLCGRLNGELGTDAVSWQ